MTTHPTVQGLNIEIGSIYSYTNKGGFTSTFKVLRVTEKSIFVSHLMNTGNWTSEMREGVTSFKKYKIKN